MMKTGYKVCDAMTKKPVMVKPDMSIKECAKLMKKEKIGSLLVSSEQELLGIISAADIVQIAVANSMDINSPVEDIMIRRIFTINPSLDIYDAVEYMNKVNIRHLPVVERNKLVGYLTLKDILKIEPQMMELIVDKYDIRESDEKPDRAEKEPCPVCGKYR